MTDHPTQPNAAAPSTPPVPVAAPPPTAPRPEIVYDDFAKIDLRVATITAAEPHPNADKLLKLQLDLGPLGTRQICAGIRAYEQPESLVGRQIIVVANLAPRKLRGETSQGMLLAATAAAPDAAPDAPPLDVVILAPSRPVPPGSTVS